MSNLNLSHTYTFTVNGRKVKTVNGLLRQAGKCLFKGEDLHINSKAISGESWSVNSTIVPNHRLRLMSENELVLVLQILKGEHDYND